MSRFALELLDIPGAVAPIYKLKIKERCPFDEFCEEIEQSGNNVQSLYGLIRHIEYIAYGRKVPAECFKVLKRPKGDKVLDFEFKVGRLRVYGFEEPGTGKIIVLGAVKKGKSNQNKSIEAMRSLKITYLDSK